jgi:hypothetical protein
VSPPIFLPGPTFLTFGSGLSFSPCPYKPRLPAGVLKAL